MNKDENLEKLDIELRKVDSSNNLIYYLILGVVFIAFILIIYIFVSGQFHFSIFINVIIFFSLFPVMQTFRKKKELIAKFSNSHGLQCLNCNRIPDVTTIHRAYKIDFCPFCQLKYKP